MEGFLKVAERLFRKVLLKRLEPKNLIAKKEFLNVKIKRSRNANKTFTQRFLNVSQTYLNVAGTIYQKV